MGLAVLMLVAGQTLFRDAFGPLVTLAYWFVCFLLTMLAIAVALPDLLVVRRRAQREHRELVESTFGPLTARSNGEGKKAGESNPR